jgi:hypothetical protein
MGGTSSTKSNSLFINATHFWTRGEGAKAASAFALRPITDSARRLMKPRISPEALDLLNFSVSLWLFIALEGTRYDAENSLINLTIESRYSDVQEFLVILAFDAAVMLP